MNNTYGMDTIHMLKVDNYCPIVIFVNYTK